MSKRAASTKTLKMKTPKNLVHYLTVHMPVSPLPSWDSSIKWPFTNKWGSSWLNFWKRTRCLLVPFPVWVTSCDEARLPRSRVSLAQARGTSFLVLVYEQGIHKHEGPLHASPTLTIPLLLIFSTKISQSFLGQHSPLMGNPPPPLPLPSLRSSKFHVSAERKIKQVVGCGTSLGDGDTSRKPVIGDVTRVSCEFAFITSN